MSGAAQRTLKVPWLCSKPSGFVQIAPPRVNAKSIQPAVMFDALMFPVPFPTPVTRARSPPAPRAAGATEAAGAAATAAVGRFARFAARRSRKAVCKLSAACRWFWQAGKMLPGSHVTP